MSQAVLQKAKTSTIWLFADSWFSLAFGLVSTVILARILGPEVFGTIAIAGSLMGAAYMFVGPALTECLKQRETLEEAHAQTVFWTNTVCRLILTVVFILTAPIAGQVFRSDLVAQIIPALALAALIGSLADVPEALIERELDHKGLVILDAIVDFAASLTAIGLALAGFGVWSLVFSQLVISCAGTAGIYIIARWRPRFIWSRQHWGELYKFNRDTIAINVLGYLDDAIPRLAIGAVLGEKAVGLFSLAMKISSLLAGMLLGPFSELSMTVTARLQSNLQGLRALLDRVFTLTTFLLYPTMIGAILVAPLALPLLFGERWDGLVPAAQVALLLGIRHASGDFSFSLLIGVGATTIPVIIMAIGVVALAALMPFALMYGTIGVVALVTARVFITWPISAAFVSKHIDYSALRQFTIGWRSLLAALVMAACVLLLQEALPNTLADELKLFVLIMAGGIVYTGFYFLVWSSRFMTGLKVLFQIGEQGDADFDSMLSVQEPI
ncbi:MAG: lipopolysaccharide biosynthesis protein [Henriciella sp.]